ncbi:MAG: hypothetical protein H7145_05405 [Akkermansiaceae bacterium]|nr:hypothetical protein [Armatimonadota bacterium]
MMTKTRFFNENVFLAGTLVTAALISQAGCALAEPPMGSAKASLAAKDGAPRWTKMPLLTSGQKKEGIFPGGEGCQWPRELVISDADPNFLILSIDVGGLYRTLDGGKNWEQASVGWSGRGCNGVAIDPKNPSHVIGLAGNSVDWQENWGQTPNGIYLSSDKAASWKPVMGLLEGFGNSVAIDPDSYDATRKVCTIAYVASAKAGLLKTTDGGETWSQVSDLPAVVGQADGGIPVRVRVSPKGGVVYLGGKGGFHCSTDGGKSFTKVRDGAVSNIAVVSSAPKSVWVSGSEGVIVSRDQGRTFTVLPAKGMDREADNKIVQFVSVSPADPNRLSAWIARGDWQWHRYYSHDGGKTFGITQVIKTNEPMPNNVRNGFNAWHPKDPNIMYGLGGDTVTRSVDGGKTLRWYNNGYNGVMMGGMMNFSAHAPKTVFLAFQDYNAAATQDGGAVWDYLDASGKGWGGHCYGGHAVDSKTFFYGDAEGWGDPRRIRITHDAGKTWEFVKGADGKEINLDGANVSLSDPTDANILFCYNHRSTDKGKTWQKMTGCEGVFIYSPDTKVLWGRMGGAVVSSSDKGATWQKVAETSGTLDDVAVDHKTGRVYVAAEDKLKAFDAGRWIVLDLPADQFGNTLRCVTVATDPRNPQTVYVAGPRNTYATQCTAARSTDGGKTWRNLTVTLPLKSGLDNGPHEVSCIRVHPQTGEAWAAGQCYGMWRIAPPSPGEKGTPAEQASAPKSVRPPLAVSVKIVPDGDKVSAPSPRIVVANGDMENGADMPDNWTDKWEGRGKITLYRDTTQSKSGKASLKVKTTGDTQGQGAQMILDAPAGATFTISGSVKSKGTIKVNFAVQPRKDSWEPIAFEQVGYVQNDSEWQSFTKKVTLPEGSVHAAIILLVEGDGEAWLDDVKIGEPDLSKATVKREYQPQPAKLDPVTPMHGFWADYPTSWWNYAGSLKSEVQTRKPDVVFIGDSITQGWKDAGKSEWEKRFAPLNAVNVGIGGDKTNEILWRINDGLFDGLSPKLVVLAIGVNNMWRNDFGNARIAEGIEMCVKTIRAKTPRTKILVVGVFPTQEAANNGMRAGVKEINAETKKRVVGMKNVRFVDFGDQFLSPDGSLSKEVMPDFLHANEKGYAIYAANLEPVVKEMIR